MANDIKLNLKEFKHIKSDKGSTTLQHRDGHVLTLAHTALSKPAQFQLQALADAAPKTQKENTTKKLQDDKRAMMAEGGLPEEMQQKAPPMSVNPDYKESEAQPPSAPPQEPQQDPSLQAKKDIYNQKLAGSGVAATAADMFGPNGEAPQNPVNPQLWSQAENSNQNEQLVSQELEKRKEVAKAGDTAQKQQQEHESAQAQNVVNAKLGIPLVPDPGAPTAAPASGQPQQPQMQQPQDQGITPPSAQGAGQEVAAQQAGQGRDVLGLDTMGEYQRGTQERLRGQGELAGAQTQVGKEKVGLLGKQIEAEQLAKTHYQDQYNTLEQERQNLQHDVQNGQIDPEKFWDNHSKIASGIGMIIAGFNPTNNPNAAIGFLKNQMEMNLQAQAKNLESKQNLLRANLQQFGNLKDATTMTRIMQNDIMANQLDLAAAKAATPMAQAQLHMASGQLKQEAAIQMRPFALQQAMMRMSAGGAPGSEDAIDQSINQMQVLNPEYAKQMQSRRVPGWGLSKSIPVPEKIREDITAKTNLQSAASNLAQYSKSHTNIIPGTAEYNMGVTKAMAFQQMVREGLLGTVFRESEKPLLEKFVNENPAGAFKSFTTAPQLKAIMDSNARSLQTTANSYGLTPSAETKQLFQSAAPQAAEIPEGIVHKMPNGVMAKRVNGQWREVKK